MLQLVRIPPVQIPPASLTVNTLLPAPRPFDADFTGAEMTPQPLEVAANADDPIVGDASTRDPRRGGAHLLWWAVIVFVAASLGAIVYKRSDVFQPDWAAAREEEHERLRAESRAAYEASQEVAGEIHLDCNVDDAAVWLSLGRTPVTSFDVPSAMIHQLRIEHEGYASTDVAVAADAWKTVAGDRQAIVDVSLEQAANPKALPVLPAEPGKMRPGGPGRGPMVISSEPKGASVWLLVGVTPDVTISGLPAGRPYDLKVMKDGFFPAFTEVKAQDWFLSGPDGPVVRDFRGRCGSRPELEGRERNAAAASVGNLRRIALVARR